MQNAMQMYFFLLMVVLYLIFQGFLESFQFSEAAFHI